MGGKNSNPGRAQGVPNFLGILRAYGNEEGVLREHIHNTQGDDIAYKKESHLQFLTVRGHGRGPRRRSMWRLPKGLANPTLRQYLVHAGG